MTFDALTLAALQQELGALLVGGRVQRIVRVSPLALGLEIYVGERHQLLLSAEPTAPQIRVVKHKLRRGEEKPSPLSLLLAKYVEGARLVDIAQPELERVLSLGFAGEHGSVRLICELMGNLSNLVLVDGEDRVMEAAKRVPRSINRYREVLPNRHYVPPPLQDKLDPRHASAFELVERLEALNGPLARRLTQALAGVSPLLAREALYRAGELDPTAETAVGLAATERLLAALGELWALAESGEWEPCVGVVAKEGVLTPVAFAPYALTHLPAYVPCQTVSDAAAMVLDRPEEPAATVAPATVDGYARARARLVGLIEQQLARRERRLAALQEGLLAPEELAALLFRASAILAVAWRIEPGQEQVTVTRTEVSGDVDDQAEEPMHIRLDPSLSPAENAEALFAQYRKRQAAQAQVPALIAQVELEIAYLRQLATDVALATDRGQLDEVELALAEAGYLRRAKKAPPAAASEPLSFLSIDGLQVLVGRNSRQNAEVTFRRAAPEDLWLHAHGVPGAHVIIRCGQRPVSADTLSRAARLAAYYSAARDEARVQVDYVARKQVHPLKGAGLGLVTYRGASTMVVEPDGDAFGPGVA